MSERCSFPMPGSPTFSCHLEKFLYAIRHADEPLMVFFWLGFEYAEKGRTLERLRWRVIHGA